MPLPLTISCSSKSRLVLPSWFLPFWYLLIWVVPDKFWKSSKTIVCVCVCVCVCVRISSSRSIMVLSLPPSLKILGIYVLELMSYYISPKVPLTVCLQPLHMYALLDLWIGANFLHVSFDKSALCRSDIIPENSSSQHCPSSSLVCLRGPDKIQRAVKRLL